MLLRGGGLAAAVLLGTWSLIGGVVGLYLVWFGLGVTMAMTLYEVAFAILTRAITDDTDRLRALASVTIFGGLASTIFLLVVGAGVTVVGWRTTLQVLIVIWLLAMLVVEVWLAPALRHISPEMTQTTVEVPHVALSTSAIMQVAAPFVMATFASMAVTTVLIPALVAEGDALSPAASVLALLGVMQLPGRIVLWRGSRQVTARGLLFVPLVLQAVGLTTLAMSSSLTGAMSGVAAFGLGAGLHTLARPWIVPQLFGVASAGQVNGTIARAQGFARTIGPFAAMAAYSLFGRQFVFSAIALTLLLCCPIALSTARRAMRPVVATA